MYVYVYMYLYIPLLNDVINFYYVIFFPVVIWAKYRLILILLKVSRKDYSLYFNFISSIAKES